MSKLYLIFEVGGAGLASTGTGLGIYYANRSEETKTEDKKTVKPEEKVRDGRGSSFEAADGHSGSAAVPEGR